MSANITNVSRTKNMDAESKLGSNGPKVFYGVFLTRNLGRVLFLKRNLEVMDFFTPAEASCISFLGKTIFTEYPDSEKCVSEVQKIVKLKFQLQLNKIFNTNPLTLQKKFHMVSCLFHVQM